MSLGTVYIVGAGPGDPGLLTVRAAELLRRANIVIHDALVSEQVLALVPAGAERIDVGKRGHTRRVAQEEVERILVAAAHRAERVVRLKGGDPFVFGRGGEEVEALARAGIRFEVVPGVTAAIGAAAYSGIPLTHRDHSSAVTFVTGYEDLRRHPSRLDWTLLARMDGTLVVYMGASRIREIARLLLEAGRSPRTPAAIVESATLPGQRTLAAPLSSISDAADRAAVQSPALLLVGDVVALHSALSWFPPCHEP